MKVKIVKYICAALIFAVTTVSAQQHTLTLGVVPQQSAKKLAETWQPLVDYIEEFTGLQIVFKTAKDIPTFEANLANGDYDIAYMNPYHFVVFNDSVGYRALARQKDKLIKGIIVVHKDSSINSLEELDSLEIAFPAPAAFAATIITGGELRKKNIAFNPRFVNSHDSVYMSVQRGFFEAGGGIVRTLNSIPEEISSDIRILWQSKGYTPHAIATHPEMDQSQREAILNALLAITNDASKAWVLEGLEFSGFISSNDNDWDDVRELGILSLSRPHLQ